MTRSDETCRRACGHDHAAVPERANRSTRRSISSGSRASIGVTSIPRGGAAVRSWQTGRSQRVGRVPKNGHSGQAGAISLSNSSHFMPMLYSVLVNPVALPPGRDRLSTIPAPTGSRRSRIRWAPSGRLQQGGGDHAGARMTSGLKATSSRRVGAGAVCTAAHRVSTRTFDPAPAELLQRLHEPRRGLQLRSSSAPA